MTRVQARPAPKPRVRQPTKAAAPHFAGSPPADILGPALMKAQTQAMKVAATNNPKARRFALAMSSLFGP